MPNADDGDGDNGGDDGRDNDGEAKAMAAGDLSSLMTRTFDVLLRQTFGPDRPVPAEFASLATDLVRRLGPRDAAEEMLVSQMAWTHARAMFLARGANTQKHPRWFALYSAECDKAMHLYRRQMLALADYRRPRRGGGAASFTTIRHAHLHPPGVAVDPLGGADGTALPVQKAEATPALPPVRRRPDRPAADGHGEPTVDGQHRPQDPAGQDDR